MNNIQDNFRNENATAYDERFEKLSPFKQAMHLTNQLVFQKLPEQAKILIVGAGTGAELLHLALANPGWNFTAIDPSADMLAVCRDKADKAGILGRCEFVEGYLEDLSSESVFHGATSQLVSQFLVQLEERKHFFTAIHKRLLPGGLLFTADLAHCGEDHGQSWELWIEAITLLGITPEQVAGYQESIATGLSLLTDSGMKALLSDAGFSDTFHCFRTILMNGWVAKKPGASSPQQDRIQENVEGQTGSGNSDQATTPCLISSSVNKALSS